MNYCAPEIVVFEQFRSKILQQLSSDKESIHSDDNFSSNNNNNRDNDNLLNEFPIDWKKADMWSIGE